MQPFIIAEFYCQVTAQRLLQIPGVRVYKEQASLACTDNAGHTNGLEQCCVKYRFRPGSCPVSTITYRPAAQRGFIPDIQHDPSILQLNRHSFARVFKFRRSICNDLSRFPGLTEIIAIDSSDAGRMMAFVERQPYRYH